MIKLVSPASMTHVCAVLTTVVVLRSLAQQDTLKVQRALQLVTFRALLVLMDAQPARFQEVPVFLVRLVQVAFN